MQENMHENNFRPYAARANVLAVLERARTRNLPEVLNNDFLQLTGMPEVVFGRARQALEFLNLIHEDGRPTDTLQALAGASEAQYTELLADCIRAAYREDFERIDPAQDNQGQIVDAFRRYEPRSQTSRMVMLFLGLCRAAAIPVLDAPRERRMQGKVSKPKPKPGPREKRPFIRPGGSVDSLFSPGLKSTVFAVTEEDIAALSNDEFNELWSALGKVARARSRTKALPKVESEADVDQA